MDRVTEQGRWRRLSAGLDRLDQWSQAASQAQRNAVYKALFSVLCGTVFHSYPVVRCADRTEQIAVLVRPDLLMRIRLGTRTFDITYIGAPQPAPE